jgi:GH35 family endo-1,4-beta-xylanase
VIIFDRRVPAGDRQSLGTPGRFYVTDVEHRSFFCPASWDAEHLRLEPAGDTPIAVHVLYAAPGYGPLWLSADNEGRGYTPSDETHVLLEELALSQLARCYTRAARDRAQETVADILSRLPRAVSRGEGLGLAEARALLGEALRAGEDVEHALSQRRGRGGAMLSGTIFGERNGPYAIGVGPDWPAENTPDFLRPAPEWKLIAAACQATTLPNFWRWVEYEPGVFNWKPLDRIMDYALDSGMCVKSFALYWGGIGGVPPWFRHQPYERQKDMIRGWVELLVGRYRGRISAWETVNEMHDWHFCNRFGWAHGQILEVTRLVNELVGEIDPGIPRVINNCCIWGDYLQHSGMAGKWSPHSYMEEVLEAGIAFEGIGLQFYNPGRDMLQMALHLDRFIALGKGIYITEMGTPSAPAATTSETDQLGPAGGWRDTWTDARQAEWVDRILCLTTARPEVEMVNYWDFDDATSFVPSAGLLDGQGQPKPSYHAWQRWHQALGGAKS